MSDKIHNSHQAESKTAEFSNGQILPGKTKKLRWPKLRNYRRIHTDASQKLAGVGNTALLPYIYRPHAFAAVFRDLCNIQVCRHLYEQHHKRNKRSRAAKLSLLSLFYLKTITKY